MTETRARNIRDPNAALRYLWSEVFNLKKKMLNYGRKKCVNTSFGIGDGKK